MASQDYRGLDVWHKSIELVKRVYRISRDWPREEQFGLISQVRRAAVSIPANIAEGQARLHRGDFLHHLSIARGSLAETRTLLIVADELGYSTTEAAAGIENVLDDVGKMLHGLIRSQQTDDSTRSNRMYGFSSQVTKNQNEKQRATDGT